ncbi:MAG: PIN domain-containing protein [Candidatus Woesearchaeota archaeon]
MKKNNNKCKEHKESNKSSDSNKSKDDFAIVLLDTNFLLIPAELRVDVFSELKRIMLENYKVFVLDKSIGELENIIRKGKGREKMHARVAMEMLKRNRIKVLKTELKTKNFLNTHKIPLAGVHKSVDDLIFEFVLRAKNKKRIYVATQDSELKKRLSNVGCNIIFLRKKSFLKIE